MVKVVVPLVAAVGLGVVVWWAVATLDPDGCWFALVVVWAPMTALGTASHVVPLRLSERFHRLRPFELDGRVYERIGVRVVKRLARRGPISWWNPGLRLPSEHTDESLAGLGNEMRRAEATHVVLFLVGLVTAGVLAGVGCWAGATWVLVFDVLLNGYPAVLQRYNRALLARRFGAPLEAV
jgi:hypothetical protein